ncbi:MAG: hypothetical protein ACLFQC_06510 [Wenzhouxiangella sp.]
MSEPAASTQVPTDHDQSLIRWFLSLSPGQRLDELDVRFREHHQV